MLELISVSLASFIDSIDDVRAQFGDEYAEAFAYRLVLFGVRRMRFCDLNPICNATLESIFPKIEKSKARMERKKKEVMKVSKEKNKSDEQSSMDEVKIG